VNPDIVFSFWEIYKHFTNKLDFYKKILQTKVDFYKNTKDTKFVQKFLFVKKFCL
jgi:hypothetical protein